MSLEKTISARADADRPLRLGGSCIVLIYGGNLGECHPITGEVTVGRADANRVVVHRPDVSRRHLKIYRREAACLVEDLGSTNGTYLNDEPISGPTRLRSGDLIRAGQVVFKYLDGTDVEALYHEEIYRMTITDGLTRLFNKRYFEGFLEREIARSHRHGHPLALAMLDVDGFKSINDTHGHLVGDSVLVHVAQTVERFTRRENLVARYGGDEFVLVIIEAGAEAAAACCREVCRRIREAEAFHEDTQVRITISGGVASKLPPMTARELIEAADRALYAAKEAGGDRIVVAEEETTG